MWDLQELSGCYSVKQVGKKSTFNKPDSSLFVCFFFLHCCFFLWQLHWKQIRASMCLQSLLPLSIYSLKLNMSPVCRSSYLHKALVNKPDVLMYLENKEMFFPSLLLKLECWWKKNVTVQSTRRKLHEVIQPVSTSTFLNIAQVWFATQENMDSCNREAIKKQHK